MKPVQAVRTSYARRLPIGAEVEGGEVHFRVWAPDHESVTVVFDGSAYAENDLDPEAGGYFSGAARVPVGTAYRFKLGTEGDAYPDPASRFQPQGPHGPSEVVDPSLFRWTDKAWQGVPAHGQVLYEMHIGTFTPEGTWAAAIGQLSALAELGITCLEVMPVADFPGKFGWGYDGVDFFAPTRLYGSPDDFRNFVDHAHALGLGVVLDVVYNHFGPDGMYLKKFSDTYLTDKHKNDWGQGVNFDAAENAAVREFFVANARYWIEEFHLDGFRFDATQALIDDSKEHILAEIARECRAAAPHKQIYLIAENEPQESRIVRTPADAGYGLNALWNDDFHHTTHVAVTGHNEAYYHDYHGSPQEIISAAKRGYLFQGQRYDWQGKRRGTFGFDLPPTAFVHYLQNHDQVANSARGLRMHQLTSPGAYRAMSALLLLLPQTPLLFQGQEFAASSPFLYFADHHVELNELIRIGRGKELCQFPSIASSQMQALLADPGEEHTFARCKLDLAEREKPGHREVLRLHQDLLRIRKREPFFAKVSVPGQIDGAVLSQDAFVLRYFTDDGNDLLLFVNLGTDLQLRVAPEPLLAPPAHGRWDLIWSSEDPQYGGSGTCVVECEEKGWRIPGQSAVLLHQAGIS